MLGDWCQFNSRFIYTPGHIYIYMIYIYILIYINHINEKIQRLSVLGRVWPDFAHLAGPDIRCNLCYGIRWKLAVPMMKPPDIQFSGIRLGRTQTTWSLLHSLSLLLSLLITPYHSISLVIIPYYSLSLLFAPYPSFFTPISILVTPYHSFLCLITPFCSLSLLIPPSLILYQSL